MTYRTCKHIFDTGHVCANAAIRNQNYCAYHAHHRARLMRIAQYHARRERLLLTLPPLENMYAVQSALNHLSEAAAAGMIDLKQARFLLSVVRAAGQFLLRADKWPATPYHYDQPGAPEPALSLSKGSPIFRANPGEAEIDLVKQYGLPADLNLDLSPELAFPPNQDSPGVIPSEEGAVATDDSKDPFVSANGRGLPGAPSLSPSFGDSVGNQTHHRPLATDHSVPDLPFSGSYCGEHHSRECECCRIRPDYPVTPESVEVIEVYEKFGDKAASLRNRQLERNRQRRLLRNERKRYQAVALERNLLRAADIIAERKLAERDAPQDAAVASPVQGREAALDQKKPAASADASANLTAIAAKSSA
jgi:hypothetical protein